MADDIKTDVITAKKEDIEKAVDKKADEKAESKTIEIIEQFNSTMKEVVNAFNARPADKPSEIPELMKQFMQPVVKVADIKHKLGITAIVMANAHYNGNKSETPFTDGLKGFGIEQSQFLPESQIKNLNGSIFTDGGVFIPEIWASEIIPMLNANAVVRKAGARVVDLPSGNLSFPKALTNPTMYWRGETGSMTKSSPTFGSVTLAEKTGYINVPVSDKLLKNARTNTAALVEDLINQALVVGEDDAFLEGTGSAYQPQGITLQLSNTAVGMTGGGSPTAATRKTDLLNAKKKLIAANIQMLKPCWIMNPNVLVDLESQVDSNSNAMDYARTISEKNTLFGYPVYTTTQLAFSGTTTVYLFDMGYVVIGQGMNPTLEFFKGGSYWDGTKTVSGQDTGESVFRALEDVDIKMTQTLAGAKITGVTWGA